jgi:hypothetical protein
MKVRSLIRVLVGSLLLACVPAAPALADPPPPPPTDPPPTVSASLSSPDLYPVTDGYKDRVKISWTTTDDGGPMYTFVRIAPHEPYSSYIYGIWADSTPGEHYVDSWDGRDFNQRIVPEGVYDISVHVTDYSGQSASVDAGTVTVSHRHLVHMTWTKTVTAAGSMVDRFVGACSTLRRPSKRGWTGSLGYYSNTRCKKTFRKSLVATEHRLTLPAIPTPGRYDSMSITAYGGAARTKPRSYAYLEYLKPTGDIHKSFRLTRRLTTHTATWIPVRYLTNGRNIYWIVDEAVGYRYDIKNFTIRLDYLALQ